VYHLMIRILDQNPVYKGKTYTVPEVLVSGDHKKIDMWRKTGEDATKKDQQK
jgi:tRNA G37 N-methylase TrmD